MRRILVLMSLFAVYVCLFIANAEAKYTIFEMEDASYLPEALIEIEEEAFEGTNLSKVVLTEGLEKIGDRAFANNVNLRVVVVPASVNEIPNDIFDGAWDLVMFGSPGSAAADLAHKQGIPFLNRALLYPALVFESTWKAILPFAVIIPFFEEKKVRLKRKLRNILSLRRQDRPEMNIPEAAIP